MSSYQNAFLESEHGLSLCLRLVVRQELLPLAKSLPSVTICSPLIDGLEFFYVPVYFA